MDADPAHSHFGASQGDEDDTAGDMLSQFRMLGTGPATTPEEELLGEDNLTVRLKARPAVKAAQTRPAAKGVPISPFAAEAHTSGKPEALDLNNEEHLAMAGLEDPDLVERMRDARESLQRQEKKRLQLPQVGELREQDTTARRALSALIVNLNEQKMKLQCVDDEVSLQVANIGRLVEGKPPHGFPAASRPADEPMGANFGYLAKKLTAANGEIGAVLEGMKSLERELTLVRRQYEQIVDGLRALSQ
jgi:hypothetical protein